jgi:hypothetical protein
VESWIADKAVELLALLVALATLLCGDGLLQRQEKKPAGISPPYFFTSKQKYRLSLICVS